MLTEELMKQVRQLQISTRRAINENFAGQYSSAFRGRGIEFAEVREYQPGDDVRTIDWNVTARAGHPFVKLFVEERELTVIFAVDMSASGQFGSVDRFKNRTAAELCAVLSFTAARNNDRVGLLIFTDEIELYIPPKKGQRHVLRLIRELLNFEPTHGGTDLAKGLEHLSQILNKRSVVFFASDFLVPEFMPSSPQESEHRNGRHRPQNRIESALRLLNRKHDVITVRIADPREAELPRAGLVELHDAETGERFVVDSSSKRFRRAFESHARRFEESLAKRMRRLSIDHISVRTGESYVPILIELFHRRERRR